MNRIFKILIGIWLFLIPQITLAQNTMWMSPSYSSSSDGLFVESVEFYSDATILTFRCENYYETGGWVQLSRACKLKAYPSGKVYNLTSARGIPYAPTKHYFSSKNETLTFTCEFPAVPTGTTHLDWFEEEGWIVRSIKSKSNTVVSHSSGRNLYSTQNTTNASNNYSTTNRTLGSYNNSRRLVHRTQILWTFGV